jgi:hypothetical protein
MKAEELRKSRAKLIEVEDEFGTKFVKVIDGHLAEVYPNVVVLPDEWWEPLWELYDRSLKINDAIQEQRCYDRQSFFEAIIDPEYIKVVSVLDKEPVGLMLGTCNLVKAGVAYINPEYLKEKYPEAVSRGRLLYMTCGYFSPDIRSIGFLKMTISLIAQTISKYCDVFAGDVSDPRFFLKDAIRYGAEQAGVSVQREDVLGQQTYFALILDESN